MCLLKKVINIGSLPGGWAHTENTIGQGNSGDSLHEYMLEARFSIFRQFRDNLSFNYQLSTKQELDKDKSDSVKTRLAYFIYKAGPDTTIALGKNAYWMADGLLMDDFVRGVSIDY